MRYTLVYSENFYNGKPAKRYELKNLTIENVRKVVELLRTPMKDVLIKFVVYDSTNAIYAVGDNRGYDGNQDD